MVNDRRDVVKMTSSTNIASAANRHVTNATPGISAANKLQTNY